MQSSRLVAIFAALVAVAAVGPSAASAETYTVTPGSHWIAIGKSWADAPVANDCSVTAGKLPAFYFPPVTVDLTVEVPAACLAARKSVTQGTGRVASLRTKVANASGDRKAALKKQLKTAKSDLKKAKKSVKKSCP